MRTIAYSDEKGMFKYYHANDDLPVTSNYTLHNHNDMCEIIIFLRGNCRFRVEGTVYLLHPFDIAITQSAEMHVMCHLDPPASYERIVLNIHNSFFVKNNCEEFKKIFTGRTIGKDNVISADLVKKHRIDKIAESIDEYLADDKNVPEILIRSKITELLYNINRISVKSDKKRFYSESITPVLMYINENISSPLSLDTIAAHFYMNKYHLCHVFKQQTGLTVNKYITYKRILLVRELCSGGMSLTRASLEAGFGNYSNFYKMYVKETGKSPKEDLGK